MTFLSLLRLECLSYYRQPHAWLYPNAFFLMLAFLFPITLSQEPLFLEKTMPACLWIAALFVSVLSIENIFNAERAEGCLEQWLLSATPLPLQISLKLTVHWLMTAFPLVLFTPILGCFFHLPGFVTATLSLSLALGTIIFVWLGGFIAALTLGLLQQGTFLGLLFLPLVIPIVITGVVLAEEAALGLSVAGAFALLLGLAILAVTLLPFIIAETLKMSVAH